MRDHTMRTRRVLAVAGLGVLAVALEGCGPAGPDTHGPLGGAARGGGECAPARPGAGMTFGTEEFTNEGHSTLVLDRVGLRDAPNLRLIGAYADPGRLLVGEVEGWPPRPSPGFPLPPNWEQRQPVSGFRLGPGKTFNMVIGVTAPASPGGSTSGLVIHYHDRAGSYVLEDHFMYTVTTHSQC